MITTERLERKRLGLIVNPVAGLGGRVGLKGSDGREIQQRARALGAEPLSSIRAQQALQMLLPYQLEFELVTPPSEMGAEVALRCGFNPRLVGSIRMGETTAEDTINAARLMKTIGTNLLLFAGGDGTARDIYTAVGDQMPVLGIPAGVKIYSAVFAVNPRSAGLLALEFIQQKTDRFREGEVIDLDEDAYRQGVINTNLYGFMVMPYHHKFVQNQKTPTGFSEPALSEAIATEVIEQMSLGELYALGPGTIPKVIARMLGLDKTLVGVDVITKERLIAKDVGERELLHCFEGRDLRLIVTPIGGQGFLFGRGNQQFSPQVLKGLKKQNLIVVSLPEKINALHGKPLMVDSGDAELDRMLCGYVEIITGYGEKIIYRVTA